MYVGAKCQRCSSIGIGVMNNNENLNAEFKTLTRTWRTRSMSLESKFGVYGKVLSKCMCVPNIKGVAQLVKE